MSERYSKLFTLPENLYSEGAPVMIAAGALLKDNQTGKVLAQLKIQNIQDKAVKAATVKIAPLDTVGNTLGDAVEYQYLDLNAARDIDFGQKSPIVFPDTATRAFSMVVAEVIFSDNTIWTASNTPWEALPAPMPLEQALQDSELVKQYRIKYGENCKCIFKAEKDLWRCACGALNHQGEQLCHKCQKEAAILAALDLDELNANKDKRLEQEQQKAAEEKAAAAIRAKKAKKIAMVAIPIIAVAIVAGVLISGNMKNRADYDKAMTLLSYAETGSSDGLSLILSEDETVADDADFSQMYCNEALSIFEGLGNYKDSAEQVKNIQDYLHAVNLMDNDDYEAAAEVFTTLGDFIDSNERLARIEKLKPYEPYVGEFAYVLDGEEQHLSSHFDLQGKNIIWEVTLPDGELMGFRGYFFLSSGKPEHWPVNEDMTVIDTDQTYGTVTVKFENGNILVTGNGGYIDKSTNPDFWNRCYVKVK